MKNTEGAQVGGEDMWKKTNETNTASKLHPKLIMALNVYMCLRHVEIHCHLSRNRFTLIRPFYDEPPGLTATSIRWSNFPVNQLQLAT